MPKRVRAKVSSRLRRGGKRQKFTDKPNTVAANAPPAVARSADDGPSLSLPPKKRARHAV